MADNRRSALRYALAATIRVDADDGARGSGTTQNLSGGGLAATVDAGFPVGTLAVAHLALVFEEAESEPLALRGRIVWSTAVDDEHQIGIQFLALSAEQRSNLTLFLDLLARRPDAGEESE